ncbi:hypothetical protein V5799_024118 [Amblyomma americanum]|uniref:Uncharacterized protein n=1 Tax=Amblyomma americanum TaxID=6943 RepID=A0AAQ4ECY9_AMBAM
MNFDVDPCQDFYSHVCQRWQVKTEKTVGGPITFLRRGAGELLWRLNSTLSSVNGAMPASIEFYHLAKFYQSCERFVTAHSASKRINLLPFRAYGEELLSVHSFPAVVRYLVQLSLVRGIHTVLEVRLNKFPDAVLLRLLRGQTLSTKIAAVPTLPLEQYLKQMAAEMSRIFGRQFSATELLKIELTLEKYMAQAAGEKRQSITIFENLTEAMGLDDWLKVINAHLPQQYKLSSRSIISIDAVDVIQLLLSFFRGLADYGVVYLYVQILVDALRFDYLRRVSSNDSERIVSSCLRATRLVMRNARHIIAFQLFPGHSTDVAILRTFSEVLKSISDPSMFPWMTAFMRGEAANTLHDVRINDIGVYSPSYPFDEETRREAPSDTSYFPGLFINMKERQQWSLLDDPPALQDGDIDEAFFLSSDVFCDDQSNTVVVPASVRQEPVLYTGDVPTEYVMGTLGTLLARALLGAALPTNSTGLWSPKEWSYLRRFHECMDGLARAAFNASLGSDDSEKPRDVYIWAQSARSAFNALRAVYEKRRTTSNWESYWRSAQKTFFRRFCLLSCSVSSQQQRLTSRAYCLLPLLNMKEFAVAFNCAYPTALYSSDHCAI